MMDVGAPWRGLRVDPDATMNADKQAALLDQYGFAGSVAVADMVNVTSRQVYTVLTSTLGPFTANPVDTVAITAAIEGLTPNPELSAYDFSGMSVFTRALRSGTWQVTNSIPATLISETHALASGHNGPQPGDTCYWRTPAGGMASADVAAVTYVSGSANECKLIRFSGDPDPTLKRYAICTDASLVDYVGGAIWCIQQEQKIRLRVIHSLTTIDVLHEAESNWNAAIENGSGRPGFVALTNGELIITGTIWRQYSPYISNNRVSAVSAAIQTAMDPYSETLTTYTLPAPNFNDGSGDGQFTGYSIFKGHIFGKGN